MPILRHAMLANAASVEQSGLVSMLGAFIDRLTGPQLPVRGNLWLVARVDWEDQDFDTPHTILITVERRDDGEQIARVEGNAVTNRPPEGSVDSDLPVGGNLIVPLFLEFRREGLHAVTLSVDSDRIWEGDLKVTAQLPAV